MFTVIFTVMFAFALGAVVSVQCSVFSVHIRIRIRIP